MPTEEIKALFMTFVLPRNGGKITTRTNRQGPTAAAGR